MTDGLWWMSFGNPNKWDLNQNGWTYRNNDAIPKKHLYHDPWLPTPASDFAQIHDIFLQLLASYLPQSQGRWFAVEVFGWTKSSYDLEMAPPSKKAWHHASGHECPANAVTPWSCFPVARQSMGNKSLAKRGFGPVNLIQYILPSGLCCGRKSHFVSTTGCGNVWRSQDAIVWTTYTTVLLESCQYNPVENSKLRVCLRSKSFCNNLLLLDSWSQIIWNPLFKWTISNN